MTYPPQQPQGDWGGQPYDPQQGQGQEPLQSYDFDPYAAPPADPYAQPQPTYNPTQQYSAPPVSAAPASGQPYGGGPMMPPQPAPSSGPPVWIFAIGGVVLLAILAVGAFFIINSAGGDPDDEPTDSAQQTSAATSDAPTSSGPSSGDMIYDSSTGLGFNGVDGWDPTSTSQVPGFLSFQGQQYEVASNWVAILGVGEIDTSTYKYKDSGDLKDTVKALADDYDNNNFGEPKGLDRDKGPEYSDEKLAGKDAVTMAYHLTWDEGENPDTGEQIVFAVIDLGGGKAAGFLGSMPDSTPSDQVDAAVEAVETLAFS